MTRYLFDVPVTMTVEVRAADYGAALRKARTVLCNKACSIEQDIDGGYVVMGPDLGESSLDLLDESDD